MDSPGTSRSSLLFVTALVMFMGAASLGAAGPPITDEFTASPAAPVPGQVVRLTLRAHDPDCATSCTTGCGAYIRPDLFVLSDNSGRTTPSPFANIVTSGASSPFTATFEWTAPPAEGRYTISAQVSDSGTSMCGGRQTAYPALNITVSSNPAPVIDAFVVNPPAVLVGGTATLTVTAHDPLSRQLSYAFSADAGTIVHTQPSDAFATWTAPASAGTVNVHCHVTAPGAPTVSSTKAVGVEIGTFNGEVLIPQSWPTRIDPLPDGRLAIVDGRTRTLLVASREGAVSWRRSGLATPAAVAHLDGQIFVLEREIRSISVWSTNGARLRSIPLAASAPNDLAADAVTHELVLSDSGAGVVMILDPVSGAVKREAGRDRLLQPAGVWAANGRIGVADPARRRLFVFDAAGALVSTFGDDTLFIRPQAVSRDPSNAAWIVSDAFSGEIQVLDDAGAVRGTLGGFGGPASQVVGPIDASFLPWSSEIAVTTFDGPLKFFELLALVRGPGAPTGVSASDRAGDDGQALVVSWTPSPDDPLKVVAYHIERDNGGDGVFIRLTQLAPGNRTWTDLAAGDGRCHTYRVIASDGVRESGSLQTECLVAVNDLPPGPSTSLTALALTPFEGRLRWSAVNAPDLSSYQIQVAGPGEAQTLVVAPASVETNVGRLAPETKYAVTLRAVDTAGNLSSPIAASLVTWPDEAPPAPREVIASDLRTGGSLAVSWQIDGGRVPVDHYVLSYGPIESGWPTVPGSAKERRDETRALINGLHYNVSVVAVTPWGREGASAASNLVVPTATPLALPVLARAGRIGGTGMRDSMGVSVTVPFTQPARTLKFYYRTLGTTAELLWNGQRAGDLLPDTAGAWIESSVELFVTGSASTPRLLTVRNTSFPSYSAEVAIRSLDLVPLAPAQLEVREFDTVIDLAWTWPETRGDFSIDVWRAAGPVHSRAVRSGRTRQSEWQRVTCRKSSLGLCRDTFLPPGGRYGYRISIVSPAGWESVDADASGTTRPPHIPPPVTDLTVVERGSEGTRSYVLDWTPLSYFDTVAKEVRAIPKYRIYTVENETPTFLGEVGVPPASVQSSATAGTTQKFLVRSVDYQGRESE